MIFNYEEICKELIQDLPGRSKKIIVRRFGLEKPQRETLQVIGNDYGITRERVRQIQKNGFLEAKSKLKKYQGVLSFFSNQLETSGKIRKEDILLKVLSPDLFKNQVFFLLSLADEFERNLETGDFYTFWTIDKKSLDRVQKFIKKAVGELEKKAHPLDSEEMKSIMALEPAELFAFLEISKEIWRGPEDLWGLSNWSEINPKSIRDKALIVFKKQRKPLHFVEVAKLIDETDIFKSSKKAHAQTVHNELIKDPQFVLVGKGLYALGEWGYRPGTVKDIIAEILREAKKPLTKEEVIEKALEQRFVEKNTVLLNLRDKNRFSKDLKGRYALKKS